VSADIANLPIENITIWAIFPNEFLKSNMGDGLINGIKKPPVSRPAVHSDFSNYMTI